MNEKGGAENDGDLVKQGLVTMVRLTYYYYAGRKEATSARMLPAS